MNKKNLVPTLTPAELDYIDNGPGHDNNGARAAGARNALAKVQLLGANIEFTVQGVRKIAQELELVALNLEAASQDSKNAGNGADKKLVNFRLDPEVLRQLKMLAVEKGKPMQALLCDGLNKIFIENNRPPIAK